ncbi:MAG: hypothetical protein KAU94_03750 [Verrucomicrobia bacterium]|nr:hypothetical protein [Verrucomicrobiota bacterium]
MKKIIIMFILASALPVTANDSESAAVTLFKEIMEIKDIDINSLDIELLTQDLSLSSNSPGICSAIVYALYGSAKQGSSLGVAKAINYTDRLLPDEIIKSSKKFLMATIEGHTNLTTRTMSNVALAFSFPGDEEVAEWLSTRYFFSDISVRDKSDIIRAMGIGGYNTYSTTLVVKDGLSGGSAHLVGNAATCIQRNLEKYTSFLPDCAASFLTLEKREQADPKSFTDYFGSIHRCYASLGQTILMYGDEAQTYLPLFERLLDQTDHPYVKEMVYQLKMTREEKGTP